VCSLGLSHLCEGFETVCTEDALAGVRGAGGKWFTHFEDAVKASAARWRSSVTAGPTQVGNVRAFDGDLEGVQEGCIWSSLLVYSHGNDRKGAGCSDVARLLTSGILRGVSA